MNKTTRLLISFLSLSFAVSVANAQSSKAPAWVTAQPKPKGTIVGIASTPMLSQENEELPNDAFFRMQLPEQEYKATAHRLALKQIMSALHLSVSQKSLFGSLRRHSAYKELNLDSVLLNSFIDRVMDNPVITLSGEWNDTENYWCYYSVKESAFQTYFKAFEDSVRSSATDLWLKGLQYQDSGYIYNAAQTFAQALDMITPLFYKEEIITCNDNETDIVTAIYDSYMSVYENIVIEPSAQTIPVVIGEGMPHNLWVTVSRNGVRLRGVFLSSSFNGVLNSQPKTDENGLCHFSIENVPVDKKPGNIVFSLDTEGLFDVPETFATKLFRATEFTDATIRLEPFDPIVSVYVGVTPFHTAAATALSDLILARKDFRITDSLNDADLVLSAQLSNKIEKESVSEGKIGISQYSGSANLTITSIAQDSVLFRYSIDNLQVMIPAARSLENASASVFRELARKFARELDEPLKLLEYDKRNLMWRRFK